MGYRILSIGTDVKLLETRHALLASRGYDPQIATPEDVEEKLQTGKFDLVILSVMLTEEEKRCIQAKLPTGTRALLLETLVTPKELLRMVAEVLGSDAQAREASLAGPRSFAESPRKDLFLRIDHLLKRSIAG
jgi:hypothetical protein